MGVVRYRSVLSCLLAFFMLTAVCGAQSGKTLSSYDFPGLKKKLASPLDSQGNAMPVSALISFLARGAGISVIIGANVQGSAQLRINEDVTYGDALEIALALNNLAYEVQGNVFKIMTDQEFQQINGHSFYEKTQVETIQLTYASAKTVGAMLEAVKSGVGTIVADEPTGTLILKDTEAKITEMKAIIEKAELPTVSRELPVRTQSYTLDHANVEDVSRQLTEGQVLTAGIGKAIADPRSKKIVVTDLPHNLARITALIQELDKPLRQVFIEAKIVEVVLTDQFRMGIEWDQIVQKTDPRFALQGVSAFPAGITENSFGQLNFQTVQGNGSLSAVVEALKSVGDTKILSNPHIAVQDGEEATIAVKEVQPYGEAELEAGSTNVVGTTYTFVDIGVILDVTPRINEKDEVEMSIRPEVSNIIDWYDGAPQEGVPVVKESSAETTVTVKDGVTIIIAGMIQDRKVDQDYSVPFLGKIPGLGLLFRSKAVDTVNSEIIVFLTPRIYTGDTPILALPDERKKPKPLRRLGPVGAVEDSQP